MVEDVAFADPAAGNPEHQPDRGHARGIANERDAVEGRFETEVRADEKVGVGDQAP